MSSHRNKTIIFMPDVQTLNHNETKAIAVKTIVLRLAIPVILLAVSSIALAHDVVDSSTLTGKVICGYQGWFTCPGDGSPPGTGWSHWGRDEGNSIKRFTVEMWPDLREFDPDELFLAEGVKLTNGKPGYLFSSVHPKTVARHFKWMKDTDIDGVFLQRFINEVRSKSDRFVIRNKVLENVRTAANIHGRVFAVEYDCNGGNARTLFEDLTRDWKYLVDKLQITKDPRYLHHNGKPVVIIWGLGFDSPTRKFSPTLCYRIVDFFKNDLLYGGNFCIGGVPTGWRTLTRDSRSDLGWIKVYRSWDAIHPWTVGRYTSLDEVNRHKTEYWEPDIHETKSLGIDYLPVVWPGFSWDNLKRLPHGDSLKPRLGGRFLWSQIHAARSAGAEMLFVAMFDEVDEATAIFKVADEHPVTGHWITYQGLPHDWYMRLAGAAGRMLKGEIPLTSTFPINPHCNGDEVSFNLGEDHADRITHPRLDDGRTKSITVKNALCRRNLDPHKDRYMYFAVDDRFVFQGNQSRLVITVDYYDVGDGELHLQYDSDTGDGLSAVYRLAGSIGLTGTETWKRRLFPLTDAWFGNRQN
ncbi:MAG: hypothetical protein JSV03_04625, partial [Planctomycetota bacterium]